MREREYIEKENCSTQRKNMLATSLAPRHDGHADSPRDLATATSSQPNPQSILCSTRSIQMQPSSSPTSHTATPQTSFSTQPRPPLCQRRTSRRRHHRLALRLSTTRPCPTHSRLLLAWRLSCRPTHSTPHNSTQLRHIPPSLSTTHNTHPSTATPPHPVARAPTASAPRSEVPRS